MNVVRSRHSLERLRVFCREYCCSDNGLKWTAEDEYPAVVKTLALVAGSKLNCSRRVIRRNEVNSPTYPIISLSDQFENNKRSAAIQQRILLP